MTTSEPYRPKLHFAPSAGWMNDPNGLILVDGVYHLFFQHDPGSTDHGPMHWGHATSADLVAWTEQPLALYPTELGTCYSGSSIETADGEIKLFYTAHSVTADGVDHEVQCLVHADRALMQFTQDAFNPIVPNPGLVDFRDPKVIWHAPTKRWVMLVTEGRSIGFYGSTDLKSWVFLSSFGKAEGVHSLGPWECPDMVPLQAPNGHTHWVLIVGLSSDNHGGGTGIQYFIGAFDGTHFTNANPPDTELWLDSGRDYYAAQTFFDRHDDRGPIAIAWANNWAYAKKTPTTGFSGVMSLPRKLWLMETPQGLRVGANVPQSVLEGFRSSRDPATAHIDLRIQLDPAQETLIRLFGEAEPQFIIRRAMDGNASIRSLRAIRPDMPAFAHDYDVTFDWPLSRDLDVSIYIDHGLVELCAADGLIWMTTLFYPANTKTDARVETRHMGENALRARGESEETIAEIPANASVAAGRGGKIG